MSIDNIYRLRTFKNALVHCTEKQLEAILFGLAQVEVNGNSDLSDSENLRRVILLGWSVI